MRARQIIAELSRDESEGEKKRAIFEPSPQHSIEIINKSINLSYIHTDMELLYAWIELKMYGKKGGEVYTNTKSREIRNEKHGVTTLVVPPPPHYEQVAERHFQLFFHPNVFILRLMEVATLVSSWTELQLFLSFPNSQMFPSSSSSSFLRICRAIRRKYSFRKRNFLRLFQGEHLKLP